MQMRFNHPLQSMNDSVLYLIPFTMTFAGFNQAVGFVSGSLVDFVNRLLLPAMRKSRLQDVTLFFEAEVGSSINTNAIRSV
jgi:hypothetical protein